MIQQKKIKKYSENRDCITCGLPLQLENQQVRLKSLAQNLFKVQEEERQWFCRELHDELGQWITAVYAEAEAISHIEKIDSKILAGVQSIKSSVDKMHEVIHGLMHELRPSLVDTLGMIDSLYDLKEKWCLHNPNISCNLLITGKYNDISNFTGIVIYRIVQESLNNISLHAKASRVKIQISQKVEILSNTNILFLNIEDNGKGFDPNQKSNGFGLLGMRERANSVEGEFSLYSATGHGTQIKVKVPI